MAARPVRETRAVRGAVTMCTVRGDGERECGMRAVTVMTVIVAFGLGFAELAERATVMRGAQVAKLAIE